MKYLLITAFSAAFCLNAIIIIDPQGLSSEISFPELASLPRTEMKTIRYKDGQDRLDTWQGIRFDHWLQQRYDQPWSVIRFKSADRYLVNLNRAEFDTLECWLVFTENGRELDQGNLRIILPALRDMKWVRDLQRVVLENFDPLKLPSRFEFLEQRLESGQINQKTLSKEDTKAYPFSALIPQGSSDDRIRVILYSRDGIKLSLEYPQHLAEAVLEVTDDGFNLKSPQLPGGMWLREIIFIQLEDLALISTQNLDTLIALNRILDWKLGPEAKFVVENSTQPRILPLADLLANPDLLSGVRTFSIEP